LETEDRTLSVEEITDFATLVKRSDITIEECAQGFRIINILKNLGIGDMDIAEDDVEDGDEDDSHANNNYNKLFSFIDQIYKNCIKVGIAPIIIPLWIKDLLDSKSLIDIDKREDHHDVDAIIQTSSIQKEKEDKEKDLTDFDTSISKETHLNPNNNEKTTTDSFIESGISSANFKQTRNFSSSEIKIPFVSQVSFFYF